MSLHDGNAAALAKALAATGEEIVWKGRTLHALVSGNLPARSMRPSSRPSLAEWRTHYFAESSRQIGVKETNDFIYGPLNIALREQLHARLRAVGVIA